MVRHTQDILAVLRGLQLIAEAACREQGELYSRVWANSSLREVLEKNLKNSESLLKQTTGNPTASLEKIQHCLKDTAERSFVVVEGVRQLIVSKIPQVNIKMSENPFQAAATTFNKDNTTSNKNKDTKVTHAHADAGSIDISSVTLKELEEILSKRSKNREISLRTPTTESKRVPEITKDESIKPATVSGERIEKPIILDEKLHADSQFVNNVLKMVAGVSTDEPKSADSPDRATTTATKSIELPMLSTVAKQRPVPSSRIGRMASFGSLFAGLGFGTLNELTKGALGLGGSKNMREAFLSPANAERIVDTLCKVRGAALKIGQILSIQDSNIVSPQLTKAFERVRQAADYMPDWQVERVINAELGPNWRDLLQSFDDKPFAAASIGQVHRATLKNGMQVAVKIQYPGVAQSIESDIDNLVGMLNVWDVFPHGFFIDNVVKVAKRELNWEVDYNREAEYTIKFKEMISPYPEYYVPELIKNLTTSSILTTELVRGVALDKCFDLSYEHRKHIGECVMKLCLRELFELQCMQTDPNWSNFLYDAESKRLMLIDFGSTRFYQKIFITNYRRVIIAAAENKRDEVLSISREMGFLTGYETKQMEEAHVDAVMILGEMLRYDGDFDFGKQNTTERIAHLVPTMVAHRLCPPPEEIYSIHRKLSGIFLLCSRLNVKMNCRRFYEDIVLGKFKP